MISSHTTTEAFEIMLREIKTYLWDVMQIDWAPVFSMSDNCDAIKQAVRKIWPHINLGQIIIS